MKVAQNEDDLLKLSTLLRKRSLTAKQICERTGCSKPVAYARIETLRSRGARLVERQVRQGKSGPLSISYSIS